MEKNFEGYTVESLSDLETRYHAGSTKLLVACRALNDLIESENEHDGLLHGVQAIITDARTVMSDMGQLIEAMQGFLRFGPREEPEQEVRPKGKLMVVE